MMLSMLFEVQEAQYTTLQNPVRRDVVGIGLATDNATITFATDGSGSWILHSLALFLNLVRIMDDNSLLRQ